ncbi:hypothetical protein BgiMline_022720, partial [Biomphalaria glabrata]
STKYIGHIYKKIIEVFRAIQSVTCCVVLDTPCENTWDIIPYLTYVSEDSY